MTKKDYKVLANFFFNRINKCKSGSEYDIVNGLAKQLCDALEYDNNRFDRQRFLLRCYLGAD